MTLMMLGEEEPLFPIEIGCEFSKLVPQQMLEEELFAQPERNGHPEGAEAIRSKRQIGLEQPFEFQKRLVVEDDVIGFIEIDAALAQAVFDRLPREACILLLAGETFLLRGGDDAAVLDQGRRAVMIEGRD